VFGLKPAVCVELLHRFREDLRVSHRLADGGTTVGLQQAFEIGRHAIEGIYQGIEWDT
jgi:hypothetical protein